MKFETFEKILTTYKQAVNYLDKVEELGIDLLETPLCTSNDTLFDEVLNAYFDDDAIDLIYWWLFEDVEKIIYNEDGHNRSVEDIKDLYDYIAEKWTLEK